MQFFPVRNFENYIRRLSMKRTIVCMLLALSVSSSLYSSQIVLAAEQSEETLKERSNEGASENMDNIKDEQSSITSTEAVPNE